MSRRRLLLPVLSVATALAVVAGAEAQRVADEDLPQELRFPPQTFGQVPAQALFEGWPPQSLLREPYWLPWGDLSFQRAALFGRPVLFVMVTGSSLPAQQMLRGTLATGTVLSQINQQYIAVLVNADRRPDIKERYQTGSWPVISFLLPNGQPMLSQANDMGVARPITIAEVDVAGMLFLLVEGDEYWKKWPDLLVQVGQEWTRREALEDLVEGDVDELASDQMEAWLLGNADRVAGGFGAAPKFIVSGLHEYAALRSARLRPALMRHSMATLDGLLASPLHDTAGGGLYRLAALPDWGGVQAEKLLTVNTTLLQQLVFAMRLEASPARREALASAAGFLNRDLGRAGGGFYLAQTPPLATGPDASLPDAQPHVDTLVLSGPNALAGAAMLRAGAALGDDRVFEAGRAALELVYSRGLASGRGAEHVIEPEPNPRIFLVALADVALGLVDAYELLGERRWLEGAQQVVDFALLNLRHGDEDALRDIVEDPRAIGLLANPRHPLTPNARLARACVRLALHGLGEKYREEARRVLGAFAGDLAAYRVHGTEAALAIEEWVRLPLLVRIHGRSDGAAAAAFRRAGAGSPWPWTVVTAGDPNGAPRAEIVYADKTRTVTNPAEIQPAIRALTGLDAR